MRIREIDRAAVGRDWTWPKTELYPQGHAFSRSTPLEVPYRQQQSHHHYGQGFRNKCCFSGNPWNISAYGLVQLLATHPVLRLPRQGRRAISKGNRNGSAIVRTQSLSTNTDAYHVSRCPSPCSRSSQTNQRQHGRVDTYWQAGRGLEDDEERPESPEVSPPR